MKRCPFCKNEINRSRHIYACKQRPNNLIDKYEIHFKYLEFNFPYLSKKENLLFEYEKKLKSLPDLCREFNITTNDIYFLLEKFNIKKRSISESAKIISSVKYKKTCQKKYGVDNVSQLSDVKEKKKKTFLKKYGVDNIWKSKDYIEALNIYMETHFAVKRISVDHRFTREQYKQFGKKQRDTKQQWPQEKKQQVAQNMSKAQKQWWKEASDEAKNQRFAAMTQFQFQSKLESKIEEVLIEYQIPYKRNCFIAGRQFDFYLINFKIIIEVNGDFWHANPKIYNENDIINLPGKHKPLAKQIWENDLQKNKLAKQYHYHIITIWEQEINNLKTNQAIMQRLLELINEN